MTSTTKDRLKQIMTERNLKQRDILEMSLPYQKRFDIKMGKSALSQYVNGKSTPDQRKLFLLGITLGVDEAWLMGYETPKNRSNSIEEIKSKYDNIDNKIMSDLLTDKDENYIEVIRKIALLKPEQLSAINNLIDSFEVKKRD